MALHAPRVGVFTRKEILRKESSQTETGPADFALPSTLGNERPSERGDVPHPLSNSEPKTVDADQFSQHSFIFTDGFGTTQQHEEVVVSACEEGVHTARLLTSSFR